MRKILIGFLAVAMLLGFNPAMAQDAAPAQKLKVLTTFSILHDIAENIVGDRVDLSNIVGPGRDTHEYQLTPDDLQKIAAADVIIANGINFEPWLDRAIAAADFKGSVIIASRSADVITLTREQKRMRDQYAAAHPDDKDDQAGNLDPHTWQNISNARFYAAKIANDLSSIDPAGAKFYKDNYTVYRNQLIELENWAKNEFGKVQESKRKMVLTHDAMQYLCRSYKVKCFAASGFSTEHEPTARDIAALIDLIKKEQIKALFLENMVSPNIMKKIATETGAQLGGVLVTDALNNRKGVADTYIAMYRYNVTTIISAMLSGGS